MSALLISAGSGQTSRSLSYMYVQQPALSMFSRQHKVTAAVYLLPNLTSSPLLSIHTISLASMSVCTYMFDEDYTFTTVASHAQMIVPVTKQALFKYWSFYGFCYSLIFFQLTMVFRTSVNANMQYSADYLVILSCLGADRV